MVLVKQMFIWYEWRSDFTSKKHMQPSISSDERLAAVATKYGAQIQNYKYH